ncbi:MAG TPA: DUF6167 family protein [Marmoricola sp.]|nr:DUF6167 family protein [Marmoricola sp.]
MNRGFWFVAGAGAGVYASFRARRVAEAFTSDGISDRISALQLGGRLLREDIATAAAEKEAELRERIAATEQTAPSKRALPAAADHLDRLEEKDLT